MGVFTGSAEVSSELACIAGAGSFIGQNFEDAHERGTFEGERWMNEPPAMQASPELIEISL